MLAAETAAFDALEASRVGCLLTHHLKRYAAASPGARQDHQRGENLTAARVKVMATAREHPPGAGLPVEWWDGFSRQRRPGEWRVSDG